MSSKADRLACLRTALIAAVADPKSDQLRAVEDLLEVLEFAHDSDSTPAIEATELHCGILARALLRKIGPQAPDWLRQYVTRL